MTERLLAGLAAMPSERRDELLHFVSRRQRKVLRRRLSVDPLLHRRRSPDEIARHLGWPIDDVRVLEETALERLNAVISEAERQTPGVTLDIEDGPPPEEPVARLMPHQPALDLRPPLERPTAPSVGRGDGSDDVLLADHAAAAPSPPPPAGLPDTASVIVGRPLASAATPDSAVAPPSPTPFSSDAPTLTPPLLPPIWQPPREDEVAAAAPPEPASPPPAREPSPERVRAVRRRLDHLLWAQALVLRHRLGWVRDRQWTVEQIAADLRWPLARVQQHEQDGLDAMRDLIAVAGERLVVVAGDETA